MQGINPQQRSGLEQRRQCKDTVNLQTAMVGGEGSWNSLDHHVYDPSSLSRSSEQMPQSPSLSISSDAHVSP